MLLESFYTSLDRVNKSVANNVAKGSLMDHTYEKSNVMLDRVTRTNMARNTREADVVSSASTRKLTKEEILRKEAKE